MSVKMSLTGENTHAAAADIPTCSLPSLGANEDEEEAAACVLASRWQRASASTMHRRLLARRPAPKKKKAGFRRRIHRAYVAHPTACV
jgi:hypothetical protein